jgi:pimeloyl-ACP methyl ester carboxylesterase
VSGEVQQIAPVDGVTAGAGVPIAYRDYGGNGRGLVLMHGIGGNIEAMDHVASRLADTYRVVSIDIRFNGQSGAADHLRYADCVDDVEAVVKTLALGEIDVVGHSLGGVIAGHYGSRHPGSRVISIDGFGAGASGQGSPEDATAVTTFHAQCHDRLLAFAPPPEQGDDAWRESSSQVMAQIMTAVGYTQPNLDQVVARYFTPLPDGTHRRHPARQLIEDWLTDWRDSANKHILHPFLDCAGATLLIHCTAMPWPSALADELATFAATRANVQVITLEASHFAVWGTAFEEIMSAVEGFLNR